MLLSLEMTGVDIIQHNREELLSITRDYEELAFDNPSNSLLEFLFKKIKLKINKEISKNK